MEKTKRQMAHPLDVKSDERPVENDSDLHPETGKPPLEPDDITNAKAAREAARLKRDEYIVKSDLEDADQRNPLPDMKDQE
ncbi:hypothetical protein CN186_22510 [Sinorhizobium medicae]|uniref:hypothetical protein n=1 Tax=Sinorhizobium medicae TaxID=110321 RepID=UPI000FDAF578|nr:hypothetical protein [Sinorhizobium medicae]MDX1122801.1 hypothetical protein [Sinorhizobium medicae]MDX1202205.1 hypothetical protein [Sinorhizobium medicae]MDX1226188.1 hypothetical protein [Sinorhizobium medicae]RVI90915.1 hypothetical protein CN186_22510 [Sinorhizobium medicae]WQO63145.1 hypothetical protein U8C35_30120 [Sinorhizobium medicae]